MLKKFVGAIILMLILIMIFISLKKSTVPTMQLEYAIENKTEIVTVKHSTASWNNIIGGIQSDGLHPLDSVGLMPEIEKTDDLKELIIKFSFMPTSYTVRRWKDSYIKNEKAYDYYELLEISDDKIVLPNDGMGYIYEVHAIWPQGDAYYAFYISNNV